MIFDFFYFLGSLKTKTQKCLKGQSMTDFRSRFFSLKSLLTLGKYEWPKKKSSPVPFRGSHGPVYVLLLL